MMKKKYEAEEYYNSLHKKCCPFCGSYKVKLSSKTADNGKTRHVQCYCDNCHAYGPRVRTEAKYGANYPYDFSDITVIDKAVELWNK